MKITKFGHCCLLIEIGDLRILTDPGDYNVTPEVSNIDVILITHEHADHCHVEALQDLLVKNPEAEIISHSSVAKILSEANIACTLIEDGETLTRKNIPLESAGSKHACIHADLPLVQNTGFFINESLFYPGDSFHNPNKTIAILALPVAGPWMKIEEAIEYAKAIHPKVVFPVHDGMLRQEHQLGPTRRIPTTLLEPLGIKFVDMTEGTVENFDSYLNV